MNQLEQKNETKSFMKGTYEDNRLDKSKELNETMSISNSERDEYEKKIHSLGGNQ